MQSGNRKRGVATAAAVGGLLTLVIVLSGCDPSGGGPAGGGVPRATASASKSASPSPSPSRSASPTPSLPAIRHTDVHACYDGRCELDVKAGTTIALDARLGVDNLSVTSVSSAGVDISTVGSDGFIGSLLEQRPDQGGPSRVNQLTIAVEAIYGDMALIRLSLAK